jgi:hypothetical protein
VVRHLIAPLLLAVSALPAQYRDLRRGPWTPQQVAEGWVLHKTRHYQIQSECGIEKAKRLGEHMEAMNKVYRAMFPPAKEGDKPNAIKLFKDRDGFLQYGRMPGAAAYYSMNDREMVCYDTGTWSDEAEAPTTEAGTAAAKPEDGSEADTELQKKIASMSKAMEMDLLGAAAHEGWHQYFHWYVVSWVGLPSWINEGMGDYFYTAVPKKVQGQKVPAELGRIFPMRLFTLQIAQPRNRLHKIADLLHYTQQQYYADPSVCYAQGWALCQFLLHSGNPKYAKVVPTFIRMVKDDTNMETVTAKAFKGIDMAQLEQEFLDWLGKQQID